MKCLFRRFAVSLLAKGRYLISAEAFSPESNGSAVATLIPFQYGVYDSRKESKPLLPLLPSISAFPWYCAYTNPRQEATAHFNLMRWGWRSEQIFLPRYQWQSADRRRTERRALFPRYLFVQTRPDQDWRKIHHTIGVKRLFISPNELPIEVPPLAMALMQACLPESLKPTAILLPAVQKGDLLKVREGHHLYGRKGICEWSDAKRVRLLLDIMGGEVPVIFDRFHVELDQEIENG